MVAPTAHLRSFPAPTMATNAASGSRQNQDAESVLDVSLLKELAKKALVDALNAVRS